MLLVLSLQTFKGSLLSELFEVRAKGVTLPVDEVNCEWGFISQCGARFRISTSFDSLARVRLIQKRPYCLRSRAGPFWPPCWRLGISKRQGRQLGQKKSHAGKKVPRVSVD